MSSDPVGFPGLSPVFRRYCSRDYVDESINPARPLTPGSQPSIRVVLSSLYEYAYV